MTALDSVRIALREISRNRLRSALTVLGIVIGIATFVVIVALGRGATAVVEAHVAQLGENVILVERASRSRGGVQLGSGTALGLTTNDASAIAAEIPEIVAVSPEVYVEGRVTAGNRNWKCSVRGEAPDYLEIRRWEVAEGAVFSDGDLRAGREVALLGQTPARELFGDESPVDQVVRINGVPFRVVGSLTPKGYSLSASDEDNVILVPYTTAILRLARNPLSLHRINLQAAAGSSLDDAGRRIAALLRERHGIAAGQSDDFVVRGQEEIEELATGTSRTMTLLLSALACVSLVVGGVGIMNVMLASVYERTREIGIRLAVGARPAEVLRQFLVEALALSTAGGMAGVALGTAAAAVLARFAGWPALIAVDSLFVAYLCSAVVGVFFGFYPARKASRMDPIEALRHE